MKWISHVHLSEFSDRIDTLMFTSPRFDPPTGAIHNLEIVTVKARAEPPIARNPAVLNGRPPTCGSREQQSKNLLVTVFKSLTRAPQRALQIAEGFPADWLQNLFSQHSSGVLTATGTRCGAMTGNQPK